jgi:hypothetical protein
MASITTILGTDSVSSSRIVLNNNFAALNQELSEITGLLNTTAQTLNLIGLIKGGTLTINNGTDLFKVGALLIESNKPHDFNQDVNIKGGLVHSPVVISSIPTGFGATTYICDVLEPGSDFQNQVVLGTAKDGQEVTLIAKGGLVEVNNNNISGITDFVEIFDGGSLTLRYIGDIDLYCIISSFNCNLVTD